MEAPMLNDHERNRLHFTNDSENDCDYFETLAEEIAKAMLDNDEREDGTAKNAERFPHKYCGELRHGDKTKMPILSCSQISGLQNGIESLDLLGGHTQKNVAADRYRKAEACSVASVGQESLHQLYGTHLPAKETSRREATFTSSELNLHKIKNDSFKSPSKTGEDYFRAFNQGNWQSRSMKSCRSSDTNQRKSNATIVYFNCYHDQAANYLPVPYKDHIPSMDFHPIQIGLKKVHAMQIGRKAGFLNSAPTIGTGVFLPQPGFNHEKYLRTEWL